MWLIPDRVRHRTRCRARALFLSHRWLAEHVRNSLPPPWGPPSRLTKLNNVWVCCPLLDGCYEYVNCGTGVRTAVRPREGVGGARTAAVWSPFVYMIEKSSFTVRGKGNVIVKRSNCAYNTPTAGANRCFGCHAFGMPAGFVCPVLALLQSL